MLRCFGILQCNVLSRNTVVSVGWAAFRKRERCLCCGFCCSIFEFLLLEGGVLYFGKVIVERSYETAPQQGIISSK